MTRFYTRKFSVSQKFIARNIAEKRLQAKVDKFIAEIKKNDGEASQDCGLADNFFKLETFVTYKK
jgi:hypothetical protein